MDYKVYKLSKTEYLKGALIYGCISGVTAYFFYRSAALF